MNTSRATTSKGISSLLFDADPARIAQQSTQQPYDVIVIGSGMGGGVLAHSLADAKKRVLLLERGDLLFTTHALNTTRPHADLSNKNAPTQDNDIVYGLLKENVRVTDDSDPWTGGPLYCVGGRSNAWGLYIPRVDPKTLKEYFPPSVVEDLVDNDEDPKKGNYYRRAEFMMHNRVYVPGENVRKEPLNFRERVQEEISRSAHKEHIDTNNKELIDMLLQAIDKHELSNESVDVKPIVAELGKALKGYSSSHLDSLHLADLHWALMGAQFSSKDRYEFPQGAFSTTDRILEAVFQTHKNTKNKMKPPYLTALHNTLAIELVRDNDVISEVKTVTANGLQHSFRGKTIVLCAGTLDSPALLLRSGIEVQRGNEERGKVSGRGGMVEEKAEGKAEGTRAGKLEGNVDGGKVANRGECKRVPKYTGVTDHNIYGFRFSIKDGREIEAAKLQLEGEVALQEPTQAGGGRKERKERKEGQKIPFLLNLSINAQSFLSRGFEDEEEEEKGDGVCTITYEFRAPINNNNYVALDVSTGQPILHIKNSGEETGEGGKINSHIERTLSELNIFIEETIRRTLRKGDKRAQLREEKQVWKAAGLGTVAHEIGTLPMSKDSSEGVVDYNLKFHQFRNLYACDMSVMPVSAPANPSLTLVALALRLADHLVETN